MTKQIEWREFTSGSSKYRVSDQGQIQWLPKETGVWKDKPIFVYEGYHTTNIDGRTRKIHALVLVNFVGPCPPGQQCRHLNGQRGDNRLVNLKWGTPKENAADITLHGRGRRQNYYILAQLSL